MKEMNDYLASISNTPVVSIKATSGKVAPAGSTKRDNLHDSATGGETDDDSLVAMARCMDAASIISDPAEKGYYSHIPLSPRVEIGAGMEEMLAQFTKSDPSIEKKTLHERLNDSDPSINSRTTHSQHVPPLRSYQKQMNSHPPTSTSPITPRFDKTTSKSKINRDQSPSSAKILPFPNFEGVNERRRLSLERISGAELRAMNASLQPGGKTTKSASKNKEPDRREADVAPRKPIILSPPSNYAKSESTGSKAMVANSARRKGGHKKTPPNQDRNSDDEMCGVGINTRVHDEKQNGVIISVTSQERRHHHMEKGHHSESQSTSNNRRRTKGENSSRKELERNYQSKSHSEKRCHRKAHRRTRTSQSGGNLDTGRVQNRVKSSSPRISRRLSAGSGSGDNYSIYDSDDETQFFYESTDADADDEGGVDSENDMKAVGTSVVDAVKDLNERSAVAKVKNLFKLNH